MKTILISRKDHHLAKFSIFLIMVALIVGVVSCKPPNEWNLKIISKAGGSVTAIVNGQRTVVNQGEEETIFSITNSTVVNLEATPDAGYRFDSWTGKVANVNTAATNITMNSDYSITAVFVRGKEICSWEDLDAIRDDRDGHHILMNALNSTSANYTDLAGPTAKGGNGWKPIVTFYGSFNGQGFEISGLSINRTTEDYVGLFSAIGKTGVVQDVTVVNANVTGEKYVGGLVGRNWGTVSDSYFKGSVQGTAESVGGLVGLNEGTVSNSHSTGNVTGSNEHVGGLVGYNKEGSVTNSHSIGSASGGSYVGGLVGYNEGGSVTSSHSSSNVIGSNDYVGGLVGNNIGTVSSSNSTGSVTGSNKYVGGLVGSNQGTVESSHSSGNVTGTNKYVGGLVGYNKCGTVTNSYSSGNVTGTDEHVGGLVGWNEGTEENEGTVTSSNSTGNVKGNDKVGGLVGYNNQYGRVSKSHSTGSVTGEEGSDIGGLVGWNEGKVEDSYSSSGVIGGLHVGGLVGENIGTVERSYSTGNVTGDTYVGGLVGQNDDTVKKSYSTGIVTGSKRVGGLVGYNFRGSAVSDSYSTGSVAGNRYVGGLVGYNEQSLVNMCYSTGEVTGGRDVGGLVGENNNGDVLNSFWDTQTSGQPTLSDGGTGKNTTEMKNFDTFKDTNTPGLEEAWDIIDVPEGYRDIADTWHIVKGVTYPFLSWQSV